MPSVRRNGELARGAFQILLQYPEGLPAKDVLSAVERKVPPTKEETGDYPNRPGVRIFPKQVRFATIAPVKAGWLQKNKGVWYLTELGRKAYSDFPDPERFYREAAKLYKTWLGQQPASEDIAETEPAAKAVRFVNLEEAEEQAWSSIEAHLSNLQPFDFQDLVAALLEAMGYHVAWVAPPGRKGIDILAYRDPLGTEAPRIKVEVKHEKDKIELDKVKSFAADLGQQDVGIYVSVSGFTTSADEYSRGRESKITLIDARRLVELWVENHTKIDPNKRYLLPLRPVFYLAPDE